MKLISDITMRRMVSTLCKCFGHITEHQCFLEVKQDCLSGIPIWKTTIECVLDGEWINLYLCQPSVIAIKQQYDIQKIKIKSQLYKIHFRVLESTGELESLLWGLNWLAATLGTGHSCCSINQPQLPFWVYSRFAGLQTVHTSPLQATN